jgi:Ca-activated chloride channel family protein
LRALYTPNFPSSVERSADDRATVTYSTAGELPANVFDLYWGTDDRAVGLSLLSYKPAGEEGYFVLLAAPGLAGEEIVERDLVVVLDVSGSMRKAKLEQARAAVQSIVESLRPGDRFNLVAFSSGVALWREALQPVDGVGQREAVRWLEGLRAVGSTDINRALLEALAQVAEGESARPAYILFVTDGQPTQGETEVDAIVRNALGHLPAERTPRLFTFGVGYDVNTDLLDILAAELRGGSHYVAPDAAIDEAVGAFYAQVSTPVLAEIELTFGAPFTVTALSPDPLPDLFAGRQLVAVGRYTAGGTGEVALAGEVNGKARLYVYPERTLVVGGGNPAVARLWAMRQIGQLLSLIRRNGPDPELVEEITQLGVRYGIVTPYTSSLVLEPLRPGEEIPLAELGVSSEQLRSEALAQADQMYAAPAAGEAAVAASQARAALQQAEVAVGTTATVRYVAGRSFVLRGYLAEEGSEGALWVDTGFVETMAVTTVVLGSDAYFDLLAEPEMAQWLAISAELVVVTGPESAVRVTAR